MERVRAQIDDLFVTDQDLGMILEQVASLSVRLVLQTALEAEVTAFLGRDRYQRVPDAPVGYRTGDQPVTSRPPAGRSRWSGPSSAAPTSSSRPGCWAST